ncbi:RING-H2 finger protein ATL74-like [Triticum dicoccoides]|uniref:RING-H2 finger protein ATL74-like n=1 Tax=Triticum dicoccoides TaxID=85692 RepID=UPI00188DF017|nr:RING-H2 finger protein ATL74-like [Triticum dicoccoides]
MGRPDSEAPTSSIAAGLAAALGGGGEAPAPAGADSAFETNVVIILAAVFFALLFAIGLHSLARCALRYVGCGAAAAVAAGEGRASARVACSGSGIKRRVLRSLPVEVYGSGEVIDDVCAICLSEFVDGEKVRVLPLCGHGFHVRCVDAWLVSHGSCPTCRRPVLEGAPAKSETDTVITAVIA